MLASTPKPRRASILTTQVVGTATVERTGPDTVVVRNPDGEIGGPLSGVYRSVPLAVGDSVTTDIHRAEVLSLAPSGLPSAVRFTFSEPLASMRWVVWQGRGFVEVPVPATGETRSYASTDLLSALAR